MSRGGAGIFFSFPSRLRWYYDDKFILLTKVDNITETNGRGEASSRSWFRVFVDVSWYASIFSLCVCAVLLSDPPLLSFQENSKEKGRKEGMALFSTKEEPGKIARREKKRKFFLSFPFFSRPFLLIQLVVAFLPMLVSSLIIALKLWLTVLLVFLFFFSSSSFVCTYLVERIGFVARKKLIVSNCN